MFACPILVSVGIVVKQAYQYNWWCNRFRQNSTPINVDGHITVLVQSLNERWFGVQLKQRDPLPFTQLKRSDPLQSLNSVKYLSFSSPQMLPHIHLPVMVRELVRSSWTMLLALELKMLLWTAPMTVTHLTAPTLRMLVFCASVSTLLRISFDTVCGNSISY